MLKTEHAPPPDVESGGTGTGTIVRRAVALALLAASIALLAWSLWPVPRQSITADLPEGVWVPGGEAPEAAVERSKPGARTLTLSWPVFVRLGEAAEVRLELSAPAGAAQPPSGADLTLLARMELPGARVSPPGETTQVTASEQPAGFRWQLRFDAPGDYDGVVWLHSMDRSAPGSDQFHHVVSAQRFRVQARDLLGLNTTWAQALGMAGVVIGVVFGLDGVLAWFWRRFIIQ